jgi:DNA mismatch endonuclease (patch repair protein)
MSANRAKNTSPEIALRKALWHLGHRGYRLHYRVRSPHVSKGSTQPSTRPDITFVSRKLAIFVMGCFWHRCPKCNYKLPKHNRSFWKAKFDRNVARNERKKQDLKKLGWKVIFVWECDLKNSPARANTRIEKALALFPSKAPQKTDK